jgi:hypothetical protein
MHYTEPRFTNGHDVRVNPTEENARKVFRALARFGVPMSDATADDFAVKGTVYQIGVTVERIDVITDIGDFSFSECWERGVDFTYGDVPVHILSKRDLIANKKALGRGQDLLDAEKLEQSKEDD